MIYNKLIKFVFCNFYVNTLLNCFKWKPKIYFKMQIALRVSNHNKLYVTYFINKTNKLQKNLL